MNPIRRRILLSALKLFDLLVVAGAALLAASMSVPKSIDFRPSHLMAMTVKISDLLVFATVLLIWHLLFLASGLYDSRRLSNLKADTIDLIQASIFGTTLVCILGVIFGIGVISPKFLLVFWCAVMAVVVSERLLQRFVLQYIRLKGRNLRYMVIVGTNSRATEFANRINSRPDFGYRIIGFVDEHWEGTATFKATGNLVLTDFAGFPELLRSAVVDEVVIALPIKTFHRNAASIVALCEQQGITTRVLSNIFDLRVARVKTDEFEGASLITNYTGIAEGWPVVAKRAFDVVISCASLLLLLPLLLAIAVLIKLTSKGPVLFYQPRLGYNKRRFNIYKFRTMVPDAERRLKEIEHLNEMSGPVFKITNDPRVTPLGRFLRKTSLDELPQLFNVLRGDMSLVGPRPLPDRDYEGFQQDWQRRRFSVRPGITCLWQINGRNSIPFDMWMQLDLQYIDKWSLWLDFQILIRTIPAVLRGVGAV